MTFSQRAYEWNVWYDRLPSEWRFQAVLWPLIVVGAINMLLTLSIGFPFGLLLLAGFLFVVAVRVPYKIGPGQFGADGVVTAASHDRPPLQISGMTWAIDLNRRYDAMPELSRLCVFPAILVVAGLINMVLTIDSGFPFGLLFVLVIIAVVAIRVPYIRGWLKPSDTVTAVGSVMSPHAEISHAPVTPAIAASGEPDATAAADLGRSADAEFSMPMVEHPDRVARPTFASPPVAAPAEPGGQGHIETPPHTGAPLDADAAPHLAPAHEATTSDVAPPDTSATS